MSYKHPGMPIGLKWYYYNFMVWFLNIAGVILNIECFWGLKCYLKKKRYMQDAYLLSQCSPL